MNEKTSGRKQIIGSIREALGARGDEPGRRGQVRMRLERSPNGLIPGHARPLKSDLVSQFTTRIEAHGAIVREVEMLEALPQVIAEQLAELKTLAQKLECELWLSALVHREGEELDDREVPVKVARFDQHLSVLLRLRAAEDHVRLELVKDHDNPDLADLHIELDPGTLLLNWR